MADIPESLMKSQVPDPRDAPALRWGVMGPGWIATRFVRALRAHTKQQVVAVASRDATRAETAASAMGISRSHGSYEDLVADPDVDIVYVATPHTAHFECATLALEAGKHVLVEKPLAINATQARAIAALADERKLFCMEALWTFFLPKFDVVARVVADGWLGDIKAVLADYGEQFPADHRGLLPELAGGPMLDLGTYPLALVHRIVGPAESLAAVGSDAPSGVNGQFSVVMKHAFDAESLVYSTVQAATPSAATVVGSNATLTIHGPFMMPGDFTLATHDGKQRRTFTEPAVEHDALHFQAAAVARLIADGRTHSEVRPLTDSIETLEMMDAIRAEINIVFPGEGSDAAPRT